MEYQLNPEIIDDLLCSEYNGNNEEIISWINAKLLTPKIFCIVMKLGLQHVGGTCNYLTCYVSADKLYDLWYKIEKVLVATATEIRHQPAAPGTHLTLQASLSISDGLFLPTAIYWHIFELVLSTTNIKDGNPSSGKLLYTEQVFRQSRADVESCVLQAIHFWTVS